MARFDKLARVPKNCPECGDPLYRDDHGNVECLNSHTIPDKKKNLS